MKNLIVLIAMFVIPMSAFSQADPVSTFYNKYSGREDVTQVEFTGWISKKIVQYSDDADVKSALKDVEGLRVLVIEEVDAASRSDFKTLRKSIPRDLYEPLLTVRDGGTHVEFLISEANGIVSDILLMVDEEDELILLNLKGKFNLKDLDKINLDMDIDGVNHFDKLKDKNGGGKKNMKGA